MIPFSDGIFSCSRAEKNYFFRFYNRPPIFRRRFQISCLFFFTEIEDIKVILEEGALPAPKSDDMSLPLNLAGP